MFRLAVFDEALATPLPSGSRTNRDPTRAFRAQRCRREHASRARPALFGLVLCRHRPPLRLGSLVPARLSAPAPFGFAHHIRHGNTRLSSIYLSRCLNYPPPHIRFGVSSADVIHSPNPYPCRLHRVSRLNGIARECAWRIRLHHAGSKICTRCRRLDDDD